MFRKTTININQEDFRSRIIPDYLTGQDAIRSYLPPLAIITPPPVLATTAAPHLSATEVLKAFQSRLKPTTLTAYRHDLVYWCGVAGANTNPELLQLLVSRGSGYANHMVMLELEAMTRSGLSPSTICRRTAALRSLIAMARSLGVITWVLEVKTPKRVVLQDTRGPGVPAILNMLEAASSQVDSARAARDLAIVWLLFGNGLRAGEVSGLTRCDMELDQHRIWISGNGHDEKIPVTLPVQVEHHLKSWLWFRYGAAATDPVFIAMDFSNHGHQLTTRSIHRIVMQMGRRVGLNICPQGLRNSAITAAHDGGSDVRQMRRFNRNASLDSLLRYDDYLQIVGSRSPARVRFGELETQ